MLWFTSDTHFGHANVIKHANRPWHDVEEMNSHLISAINSLVAPNDDLYILGDFSFRLTQDRAAALRGRIRCRNVHLVPGNHDKNWATPGYENTFTLEPPICTIKAASKQKIIMSHYPIMDWQGMGHGSWHLHGHIHSPRNTGFATYNEMNLEQGLRRYDVGVDANGYEPISLKELEEWFSGAPACERVCWWNWVNGTANASVACQCLKIRESIEMQTPHPEPNEKHYPTTDNRKETR